MKAHSINIPNQDLPMHAIALASHTCRICGFSGDFPVYVGREMMQGSREEFRYFACANCACLQIEEFPENLAAFYNDAYYSYTAPPIRKAPPGTLIQDAYILDVGCGAGNWLCEKAAQGFHNLFGCDPFIAHDLQYENGVTIQKSTIHEMKGQFDFISLQDSYEHMKDPAAVMQSICRLLKPGGKCMIAMPVYPNVAFDTYGTHWYQLDPPRHLFLHSIKSMRQLAAQSGMVLAQVEFNSNNSQFVRSRMYQLDIPFCEQAKVSYAKIFSQEEWRIFDKLADDANKNERGDHAKFYLVLQEENQQSAERMAVDILELADTVREALLFLHRRAEKRDARADAALLQDTLMAYSRIQLYLHEMSEK